MLTDNRTSDCVESPLEIAPTGDARQFVASAMLDDVRLKGISAGGHKASRWRRHLKRVSTKLAAIAACGTIIGGLSGYWTTYRTVTEEWANSTRTTVVPPRLSIAVLPFDDPSRVRTKDDFGDALVEDITTSLSANIPNLTVIAGISGGTLRETINSQRAGQKLNVRYVLGVSVFRSEYRVRVYVNLVDTESDQQVWGDHFDGDASNLLGLQDQVTSRILLSLQTTLIGKPSQS
ncbi:hypothetical protein [Bradyrhizobium diazoefficiens]